MVGFEPVKTPSVLIIGRIRVLGLYGVSMEEEIRSSKGHIVPGHTVHGFELGQDHLTSINTKPPRPID